MAAAMQLPLVLNDPVLGSSYDDTKAAFQKAMGTESSYWEWMEEMPSVSDLKEGRVGDHYTGVWGSQLEETVERHADEECLPRPELGLFSIAMQGSGRVGGRAHLHGTSSACTRTVISPVFSHILICSDFPWETLGDGATIVDVGGGIGKSSHPASEQKNSSTVHHRSAPATNNTAPPHRRILLHRALESLPPPQLRRPGPSPCARQRKGRVAARQPRGPLERPRPVPAHRFLRREPGPGRRGVLVSHDPP